MNGWVSFDLALLVTHRSRRTLHTWWRRLEVPSACRVADRELLVWWPAVFDKTEDAEYRAPRWRKAS